MRRLRGPEEPIIRHSWHGANSRLNRPATLPTSNTGFGWYVTGAAALTFVAIFFYADAFADIPHQLEMRAEQRAAVEQSRYFSGCNEARAAGVTPIHRGEPGYRSGMDGDGDGIACEMHLVPD